MSLGPDMFLLVEFDGLDPLANEHAKLWDMPMSDGQINYSMEMFNYVSDYLRVHQSYPEIIHI